MKLKSIEMISIEIKENELGFLFKPGDIVISKDKSTIVMVCYTKGTIYKVYSNSKSFVGTVLCYNKELDSEYVGCESEKIIGEICPTFQFDKFEKFYGEIKISV